VGKFFNVDKWSDLPKISPTFQLYNQQGEEKSAGTPQVGDFRMPVAFFILIYIY
jgi:hypothetical protein